MSCGAGGNQGTELGISGAKYRKIYYFAHNLSLNLPEDDSEAWNQIKIPNFQSYGLCRILLDNVNVNLRGARKFTTKIMPPTTVEQHLSRNLKG